MSVRPRFFDTFEHVSDERKAAAVCRVVQLLVSEGFSYSAIARDVGNCLTDSELEKLRALRNIPDESMTALREKAIAPDAIRIFVERYTKGKKSARKAPAGETVDLLFSYIRREMHRFRGFVGENIVLAQDVFLDDVYIPQEYLLNDPKKIMRDFFIGRSYQFISRMLGIDYQTTRRAASDFAGSYLCIRPSSRNPERYVVSQVVIQPREFVEDVWEYRHFITTDLGEGRETDGMVLAVDQHLILLGDIAQGRGLETLVIRRPGLTRSSTIAGVTMSVSLDGTPIVCQIALIRIPEKRGLEERIERASKEYAHILGPTFKEELISDLVDTRKLLTRRTLDSILASLPRAMRTPIFFTEPEARRHTEATSSEETSSGPSSVKKHRTRTAPKKTPQQVDR